MLDTPPSQDNNAFIMFKGRNNVIKIYTLYKIMNTPISCGDEKHLENKNPDAFYYTKNKI
ncbi:MAG: hypothetical protein NC251_03475 [Lachnoclostridium sp.]|nr:hypothetical protein [Lachnospira sp.]MCM1247473.1 hypothetical protein [Lachnoclostridium sp.]